MHMLKVDGELFFCMHILLLARREKRLCINLIGHAAMDVLPFTRG